MPEDDDEFGRALIFDLSLAGKVGRIWGRFRGAAARGLEGDVCGV
jgi:hypothetical protein